jgi:hypothetical protein
MKLRFAFYWMFLFLIFSVGSVYYHLCRYDSAVLDWRIEFEPLMLMMKIIFVTFISVVFLLKTDVFHNRTKYKEFFIKNMASFSPVMLVPMGIYHFTSSQEKLIAINMFSIVVGIIAGALFIFCIFYLMYMKIKSK